MESKTKSLFSGPWFDLALELGPVGNQQKIKDALSAVWSCPTVSGPWKSDTDIGNGKLLMNVDDCTGHAYGLLNLGEGVAPLPLIVSLVSESSVDVPESLPSGESIAIFGASAKECSDWLNVSVPFNALELTYSFEHAFELGREPWVAEMCLALVQIADAVHSSTGIECGVLGEEVSGCWRKPSPARLAENYQGVGYTAVLDRHIIDSRGGFVVSQKLWDELKPNVIARVMPHGLIYVPIAKGAFLNSDGPKKLP